MRVIIRRPFRFTRFLVFLSLFVSLSPQKIGLSGRRFYFKLSFEVKNVHWKSVTDIESEYSSYSNPSNVISCRNLFRKITTKSTLFWSSSGVWRLDQKWRFYNKTVLTYLFTFIRVQCIISVLYFIIYIITGIYKGWSVNANHQKYREADGLLLFDFIRGLTLYLTSITVNKIGCIQNYF